MSNFIFGFIAGVVVEALALAAFIIVAAATGEALKEVRDGQ